MLGVLLLNTKYLRLFLNICEEKSIRKAAVSNFISPQGLSRIIKSMEEELKVMLFHRKHDGMELTEYGEVLKRYSEKILINMDSLEFELQDLKGKYSGNLNIACTYGVASAISPDFIINYKKINSKVNLNIKECPDLPVENEVYQGEASVGFTIGPVDTSKFDAILLDSRKLCLIVSKKNPLSKKDIVKFSDLKNEKLILISSEFKTYHNIIERCKKNGFDPTVELEVSEISLVHKFSALNYGCGVTVDYVVNDFKSDDVVALPIDDDTLKWEIYLITKKDAYLPRIAREFINNIKFNMKNNTEL